MRSVNEVHLSCLEPVNWNQPHLSLWVLIGLIGMSRRARTSYASCDARHYQSRHAELGSNIRLLRNKSNNPAFLPKSNEIALL
jgi:hypothetical protein